MNGDLSKKRRRWRAIVVAASAVVLAGGLCWHFFGPAPRTAPGQLITSLGLHVSPDGETALMLWESDDGKSIIVEAAWRQRATWAWRGPPWSWGRRTLTTSGAKWEIDAAGVWFFAFDDQSRLWGYAGRGPLTEPRSGTMVGPHSWHGRGAFTEIGPGGGWSGIPESFLQALPPDVRDVHDHWLAGQAAD